MVMPGLPPAGAPAGAQLLYHLPRLRKSFARFSMVAYCEGRRERLRRVCRLGRNAHGVFSNRSNIIQRLGRIPGGSGGGESCLLPDDAPIARGAAARTVSSRHGAIHRFLVLWGGADLDPAGAAHQDVAPV